MKFLVVIVGLFAISNAAVVLRTAAPAPLILGNAVVPAIAPIVKALPAVPATELSEWSAYKVCDNLVVLRNDVNTKNVCIESYQPIHVSLSQFCSGKIQQSILFFN